MRIIVTGIGSPAGAALTRQLHARGVAVIGTDFEGATVTELTEESVEGPEPADPDRIPFLRDLAGSSGAELLIPTLPDELSAVSVAAPVLGIPIVTSQPGPVGRASDPQLTTWSLEAAGVQDPPSVPLANARDTTPDVEYAAQVYRSPLTGRAFAVVLARTSRDGGNGTRVQRLAPGEAPDVASLAVAATEAIGLVGPSELEIRRLPGGRPMLRRVHPGFGPHSEYAPELLDAVLSEHRGNPVQEPQTPGIPAANLPNFGASGALYASSRGSHQA